MYFQVNNLYKTDSYTGSKFNLHKLTILLILVIVLDTILNKNVLLLSYIRVLHVIYFMVLLTGFAEVMLMHVITSSIRDQYKTINKSLCTESIQAALNKTNHVGNANIFISQDSAGKKHRAKVMEQLMAQHFELTIVAKRANKLFGLPMLITLSVLFQTITTCIYFIINTIMNNNIAFMQTILIIWWCTLLITHIWLLVYMWDSLANEVSTLLYLLLNWSIYSNE